MDDHCIPVPRKWDAYALRELAEAAASAQGPYFLIDTGDELMLCPGVLSTRWPAGVVLEINTPSRQPERPKVIDATIKPEDGETMSLMRYDAVFWSEAAVEKFVFPYLVSKSMWKAAGHLAALSNCWYHGGRCPQPTGEEEEGIPFAIGHVPDSEFVPLAEGHDLHFLLRKKDGTVYARPLAELIAEREAEDRGTAGPATRTPASPDGA